MDSAYNITDIIGIVRLQTDIGCVQA